MPKLALVANTDFSIHNFRMGLIQALLARGWKVHVVCPHGEYVSDFKKQGLRHHALYVDRKGTNPIKDVITLWQLYWLFRRERFDLVHHFTIKANIYGSVAARFARVPVVLNTITGLGYAFADDGKRWWLSRMVVVLCRFAFRSSDKVIFQNVDDLRLFGQLRIVDEDQSIVIRGSGVDTAKFCPRSVDAKVVQQLLRELGMSTHERPVIVTLISRLLWDKGISEFVEAARTIRSANRNVFFLLVGPIDRGNRGAVSEAYVQQVKREGIVKYLGERRDIAEILSISDVVTLPSYYREGVPRVLLEAMSMEKPVVTTDWVGCREVVEEGRNGLLVPVRDSAALASAIEKLINNEGLRIQMGKYGRDKVLREFDERLIVKKNFELYEDVLRQGSK